MTQPIQMTGAAEPLIGLGLRPESRDRGLFAVGKDRIEHPSVPGLPWAGTHGSFVTSLAHLSGVASSVAEQLVLHKPLFG